ncbi:MAG TPA: IS1595 family transposase [Rhizomicrobium sp.]|jgi:predicted RNA-binding Zn-ribbon protein involved in translation (DUF1610 family)/transposase-like protein
MKFTFKQFQAEFPDDAACLERLMTIKFGGTKLTCPGCGTVDAQFHAMGTRKAYACQDCGHHIYPCAGTIFHKSSTKLTNWFFAMYLMTSTRHGVAAKELQRQIGCTYKTAWRMAHELRKLMAAADRKGKLSGHIEVDEMYHGPKTDKKHSKKSKAVLFGAVERGGDIRVGVVENTQMGTIKPTIALNVEKGSKISTDDGRHYLNLSGMGYDHQSVNHSAYEWVRGDIHTNSIEGHWGLFRRAIKGTNVHVSKKHLWKYASEFAYRRNLRGCHWTMFNRLLAGLALPRLVEP